MMYVKYGVGYLIMSPMYIGLVLTWLVLAPLMLLKVGAGWGSHAKATYDDIQDKLGL